MIFSRNARINAAPTSSTNAATTSLADVENASGLVLSINAKLLGTALWGATSYWLWPQNWALWWQMGFFSIILAFIALALFIAALRDMFTLYRRKRLLYRTLKDAKAQKGSRLVSNDVLDDAGMH